MSTSVISNLSSGLPGIVIDPDSEGFDAALAAAVWNGDIGRRPAAIVRPRSSTEVASVVTALRRLGLDLTVRGGGHSFAGHAVADDAVMVDLALLDEISVDAPSRRVSCGAGVTWAALDAATAPHALAVPGGFISHTGVAGLTLGGGLGWLSRPAGLSCDHLVSAEVATADGRLVTASADDNPDLF